MLMVEPPEQAVFWIDIAWNGSLRDPIFGQDLCVAPTAAAQKKQAETRVVVAVYPDPATPVRAAGYALYSLPLLFDPGGFIAVPIPSLRGANGIHDARFEDLRQWRTVETQ